MTKTLISGAGGFVGSHLATYLKRKGYWVRGADIKYPEFSETDADGFEIRDLRYLELARLATEGMDWVFALAADMGGAGHVFTGQHDAEIIRNNTFIDANTIEAACQNGVRRYFFSSSACAYNQNLQVGVDAAPLKEEDVYPAWPDSAYGWTKLHGEHLCRYYNGAGFYEMGTRVARFHNVFGERGTWQGGKEKCPAAMCRKVAVAKLTGNPEVEIWGDGEATRSYMYIDDCLDGIYELMLSEHTDPINLGTDRAVSVNELVDIIADIAGVKVAKKYVDGPQGVRGRNADLTKVKEVLGWEPQVSLEEGLARTYAWIEEQVEQSLMEMKQCLI